MTLTFSNMPFNFSTEGYDEDNQLILRVTNTKTADVGELVCNVSSDGSLEPEALFEFRSWRSTEPVGYQFVMLTSDYLHKVLTFSLELANSQPDTLAINSFQFGGLLGEQNGSLTINYTRKDINIPSYSVQIEFPEDYPENISISSSYQITKRASRVFRVAGLPSGNSTITF